MKNLTTQIEVASYKELIETAKSLNLLKFNNVSIYQIKREDLRIQLLQLVETKTTKKATIVKMFKEGQSRREIATSLNTHISYVRTVVREAGLSSKPETTKKVTIVELFKDGQSRREIATSLNAHISYVRTVVREAGLSKKNQTIVA